MKLQIAIDSMTDTEALKFAKSAQQYADIIEVGTPMIYRYGLDFIKEVDASISQSLLLADAKIVDAGALESRIFLETGADIITVLGGSSNTTVRDALDQVRAYQAELMIDLIDIPRDKKIDRIRELANLGCNTFCIHRPSDLNDKESLFLPKISKISKEIYLSVAGGIDSQNVGRVIDYNPDVIIIGSAITEHDDPLVQASRFREIIENP